MRLGKLVLPIIIAFAVCSCSTTKKQSKHKRWKDRKPLKKTFKPIKQHRLKLFLVSSRRTFYAGEKVKLTYKLVNKGRKPVKIYEWIQDNDANLAIYYHPYEKGLKKFKPKEWTCLKTEFKEEPNRFELELNPGNAAFVSRELPFIEKMKAGSKPKKYYIIAKLNLKSLNLRSPVATIIVK